MRKLTSTFLLASLFCLSLSGAEQRDRFGGWTAVRGLQTGHFHAEQIKGVWWLITPEGNAFYSKGVNNINYTGDHSPPLDYSPYGRMTQEKYGSPQSWAAATAKRLRSWGYNTVGTWSTAVMQRQQLPYARPGSVPDGLLHR
jgi:hypothetical protein